ncbi:DUF1501 domain-containing protein [Rhizobium halophytocola]
MSRRAFLGTACCAAAAPLLTKMSFAEMPGDNRFAAIILRGAMDGLDLVQPHGDPHLRQLRPDLALTGDDGLIDLDGYFGLNPAAQSLYPLWQGRELGFVHAVSTPYRDIRSHFDGQDILESGGSAASDTRNGGWLNRTLSLTAKPVKAIDVSVAPEIILSGPNAADVWSSRSDVSLTPDEVNFIKRLYQADPVYSRDLTEALKLDTLTDLTRNGEPPAAKTADLARTTAEMLKERYRIASFSITGWDTHVQQKTAFGAAAKQLCEAITTLKAEMGPEVWSKTAVLAVTEFGRTARQNANIGTDHGTGGCAVIAGGAVKGGRVYGKWPGLGPDRLLDNRDLMPTGDIRSVAAALLSQQFGMAGSVMTGTVFPGLQDDGHALFI